MCPAICHCLCFLRSRRTSENACLRNFLNGALEDVNGPAEGRFSSSSFKSIDLTVEDREDLHNIIGEYLSKQKNISNYCPPSEIEQWNPEDLKEFKISSVNMIDRVYHLAVHQYALVSHYILRGRTSYKSSFLYFYLRFRTLLTKGRFKMRKGILYLVSDPAVFLKTVDKPHVVWQMMVKDGLDIEYTEWVSLSSWLYEGEEVPSLEFLCQRAVYMNRNELRKCVKLLPQRLATSTDMFVRVQETCRHFWKISNLV